MAATGDRHRGGFMAATGELLLTIDSGTSLTRTNGPCDHGGHRKGE
jgi:hypothetical protein